MLRMIGLIGLLFLAGCASPAELAAADDAKCRSYGSQPGEPAYTQCRAQLDSARTIATSTAIAGMNAANAQPSYRPQTICIPSSIGPLC